MGRVFCPRHAAISRTTAAGSSRLKNIDLSHYWWNAGPIALLLVDAMKSFELAVQIMRSFYTALLPGAIVIHQDFKHYYTSWIHILQYRLRDHFQFMANVSDGTTVAFVVTKPITIDVVHANSDFETIADDEAENAFSYSIALLPPDQIANVAAAHVMYYHHRGRDDRARATLAKYQARGFELYPDFAIVMRLVHERDEKSASSERRKSA